MEPISDIRFLRVEDCHNLRNPLQVIIEPANDYVVTPEADWIGLYVVGWSNISQHIAKQIVSLDSKTAFFPSNVLPSDTSNYYQLCYFDSKDELRGISTTFSFSHSADIDIPSEGESGDGVLIDVKDWDQDDLVLVKTSRNQLEIALTKAIQEKLRLEKIVAEKESELANCQKNVESFKANCEQLELKLKSTVNERAKEELLNEEHQKLLTQHQDLQSSYKRLRELCDTKEDCGGKLKSENEELTGRLVKLSSQIYESQQVIDRLEDALRNAEERISANEDSKKMLQQEVDSLMAVQRSLAASVEDSKGECHTWKEKCLKVEKELDDMSNSKANIEERMTEVKKSHSELVLNLLEQKKLTETAEKESAELKLRLEKAADEYRSLYKQIHNGNAKQQTVMPVSKESSDLSSTNIGPSLPAFIMCPICNSEVKSEDHQSHFEAHDRAESQSSLAAQRPLCPICSRGFAPEEIQNHVNSHFEN